MLKLAHGTTKLLDPLLAMLSQIVNLFFPFSWNLLFLDTKKTDRDPFSKDVGDKDFRKYYFGIDAQRSKIHSKILRRAWPKGEKVLLRVQIDAYK